MRKASQEDAFLVMSFRNDVITSKRYDDII